jgi:hypothetical protein
VDAKPVCVVGVHAVASGIKADILDSVNSRRPSSEDHNHEHSTSISGLIGSVFGTGNLRVPGGRADTVRSDQ